MSSPKQGIFRDSNDLIWSPDLGGFETDAIKLTLVANRLAFNPKTATTEGTHETSVRDVQLILADTPPNYDLPTNPLIKVDKFSNFGKTKYHPILVGDSVGTVEFDNLVTVGAKPKGYRTLITKDFGITLNSRINKLIFYNYNNIQGKTIYLPVTFRITYQFQDTEDLYGVIPIKVLPTNTQQGKSFLSPNGLKASILPELKKGTTPLIDETVTRLSLDKFSRLAFRLDTQVNPNTYIPTLYAKSLALSKYDTTLNIDQNISIPYTDIAFGEDNDGMFTPRVFNGGSHSIKYKKGITSIPIDGAFETTQYSQPFTNTSFRFKSRNISNVTNPNLIVYKYEGNGNADTVLNTTITDGTGAFETVSDSEKIYRFRYTSAFISFLETFSGTGQFYIAFEGVDFKTGEKIYYANEQMYLRVNKGGTYTALDKIEASSLFEEIIVLGEGLTDKQGKAAFDTLRVDVIKVRNSGKDLADSLEVTPDSIRSRSISFSLELAPHIVDIAKKGETLGLRVSLLKRGVNISETYTTVRDKKLNKNALANVTIDTTSLRHNDSVAVSFPREVRDDVDGQLQILLFESGNIPEDPLNIPAQGASTFNIGDVVGYLEVGNPRHRGGRFVLDCIVKTTSATDIKKVDALVLINTSPGEDFTGRYDQYAIVTGLNLNVKSQTMSQPHVGALPYKAWIQQRSGDFTLFTEYSGGGNVANPSECYISQQYYNTTTSVNIGQAFPDPNMYDTTSALQEWRLVDTEYIQLNERRWHGLADVVVETPYPITEDYTTQSVMIGREPCIERMEGSRYLTISGTGFSSRTRNSISGSISKWESCVNGVSFYNKTSKALIAHVPYADEVLRRPNGLETFAVDMAGVVSTSSIQDTYVVVSTDYGCDWHTHTVPALTVTMSSTISAVTNTTGVIAKGDVLSIDITGDIYKAGLLTSISAQDLTASFDISSNAKPYLRYDADNNIGHRVYCLTPKLTGLVTGTISISFTSFSVDVTQSYVSSLVRIFPQHGQLAIHPGTGAPSLEGWFSGPGITNPAQDTINSTTYSGITLAFDNAVGTHRDDIFDSKGTLTYTGDGYTNTTDAFYTTSGHSFTSSQQGGIAHIQANNGTNTSSYVEYYSIDSTSATIATSMRGKMFNPLGSYGSWAAIDGTHNIYKGFGVPGVSDVPWGLINKGDELTQTNLMGKAKVSVKPSALVGKSQSKYIRLDSPTDTAILAPTGSVRDLIDGNEVSPTFTSSGTETFMPLVFSANSGKFPTIMPQGGAPAGNALQAKVEYLDVAVPMFTTPSSAYANQLEVDIESIQLSNHRSAALVKGLYQKSIDSSVTLSQDHALWANRVDNKYPYKGWLYTASTSTFSSWEVVAEFTNDTFVNESAGKYRFNVTAYRQLLEGESYLLETQNTLRSNTIPITLPIGLTKGESSFGPEFFGGLKGLRTKTNGTEFIKFGVLNSLAKDAVSILPGINKEFKLSAGGSVTTTDKIINGPSTVKVKNVVLNEYGYRDNLYVYDDTDKENITSNRDNYHFTRIGKKPEIRIVSSMHVNKSVITEGSPNTLRGLPISNSKIVQVWVFDPLTGRTALVPDFTINRRFISFTPSKLETIGFSKGDYVRVGVMDENSHVYVTPEQYGLYNLETLATTTNNNIHVDLNLDETNPVVSFGDTTDLTSVRKAAVAIPYKIKSAFDQELKMLIPVSPRLEQKNNRWSLYLSPPNHIKRLLWDQSTVGILYVRQNGAHGKTNEGITITNTLTQPDVTSNISKDLALPPPKLAPSYKHTITASQDMNPRMVCNEIIYWSKQLTFDKYYDKDTASLEALFHRHASHYIGRRFAGKHFMHHPDIMSHGSNQGVINDATFDAKFSIYGNLYLDTSSGSILSTTNSIPPLPGNKLFECVTEPFVRYLTPNTETATQADSTEWQETHTRLEPTSTWDVPDVVHAYVEVEQVANTYPGLEGKDGLDPKTLATTKLTLVNLDSASYTTSDAPTPYVDEFHNFDYNEGTGGTLSEYDIQPNQINSTRDHIVRISGKNLLGNLNRKTDDIIPQGYEEPLITLRASSGSDPVTGSFYEVIGDTALLDKSTDTRLYVKFREPTGGWPFSGMADMFIQTKWSIAGTTQNYSYLARSAANVTSSPTVEFIDSRIQPVVTDNSTYSYKTFSYGHIAHVDTVSNSGDGYSQLTGVSLKVDQYGNEFTSSVTSQVWWITDPDMQKSKLYMDPVLYRDAEYKPVMFSDVTRTESPMANWYKYQPKSISGTSIDPGTSVSSLDHTVYANDIAALRFDYGLEVTSSTNYGVNDLSNTTSGVTRGMSSYVRSGLTYAHYDMPRIVSVIGTSGENIINFVDGHLTGGGRPSIDILCEYNTTGVSTVGEVQGIRLDFGDLGGSSVRVGTGRGFYGEVDVLNTGNKKLVKFYPNKNFAQLIKRFRTGGWIDISLVVGHRSKQVENYVTDFRSLRVKWTAWDVGGTTGGIINSIAPSKDAVMYRLRMLEDANGDRRVAWSGHFGTDTFETSHQDALYISGSKDDWWVFAATAEYGHEHAGKGSLKLYGAREKDLIAELGNAHDIAGFGEAPTIDRPAFRGMQLLGEYDVGPQNGMAFIDDDIYSTASQVATVSDFRFNVGRSPHPNMSYDMMDAAYSTTSGQLLGYEYLEGEISDVVVMPKDYCSHEDVSNFSFNPKRRDWVINEPANLAGAPTNLLSNFSFEGRDLFYSDPSSSVSANQLYTNADFTDYTTTALNDPPTGWATTQAGTSALQINTTGGNDGSPAIEFIHDASNNEVTLDAATDINGIAFSNFKLYRVSCLAKASSGSPKFGCRGGTSYGDNTALITILTDDIGSDTLTTGWRRYSAYVWGRTAGLSFVRESAATSITITIDDVRCTEVGTDQWYTDNQEVSIDSITSTDVTQVALLTPNTDNDGGTSIKHDVVLRKNSSYKLNFDHRSYDTQSGTPSEAFVYAKVTVTGRTYQNKNINKVDVANLYYDFLDDRWKATTSSNTEYLSPVHKSWFTNNIMLVNNLDAEVDATVEIAYASYTDDYTSTITLALDNVSCTPIQGGSTIVQNGDFNGYISSSNTTTWAWTLTDATVDTISATINTYSDRPMSGYAVLTCPATAGTDVPHALQTLDKYALQPNCEYELSFKAWSSASDVTASFTIENSTQTLFLRDDGTWGASNVVDIDIDKSNTTTISTSPLVLSQMSHTYGYKFDTKDPLLSPSDTYILRIGNRLASGGDQRPALLIDDVKIRRVDNEGEHSLPGFGHHTVINGDGGFYLPHDPSWDFTEEYSGETVFRLNNVFREDSRVGAAGSPNTANKVHPFADTADTYLEGDGEPYVELLNLGHGESSNGATIFVQGSTSGSEYHNKVTAYIGDEVDKLTFTTSTNLQIDAWYWAGLSKDTDTTASLTLYRWDGRRDTQSWQFVETTYATRTNTVTASPAQHISIGSKRKDFFHLDGFNTFLDPNNGRGSDANYRPNESAKFIWRFNDETTGPEGFAVIPNEVIQGAGELYITASNVFTDDDLWGGKSLEIPITSRQEQRMAVWRPGDLTTTSLDWTDLTTIPIDSSFACIQGAGHNDSNHKHRALTVASWAKIEQVIDDHTTVGAENVICSWGDQASNGSGFLMDSADRASYLLNDWQDIATFDSSTYGNDWATALQFAIPTGTEAQQQSQSQVGFTYYNNLYTSGSTYASYVPELCVSLWSPDSTYTTGSDDKKAMYLRMRGMGSISAGDHATHSINEWWLTLNSFMIDESGDINYYSFRAPESVVRNAISSNDSTIFDLSVIDTTVSRSKYGVLIKMGAGPQGGASIGDESWWDLVTNESFLNSTSSMNGIRLNGSNFTSLTMSVGSELTGYNFMDGKISELAILPDIFMDNTTVQDWLTQCGLGGIDSNRAYGSHYVTEISSARVNGFPLRDASGTIINGLAKELSQTNINFRLDQEGNAGTDNGKRTTL